MNNLKTCTRCGQMKSLESFSRHNGKKASKSGFRATCKSCDVEANRIYREKNRDKVNAAKRKWSKENKQSKALSDKKYREANKASIKKRAQEWRLANLERLKDKAKDYREANRVQKAIKDSKYSKENPEVNRRASRRYRLRNPEKAKASAKKWRESNPEFARIKSHRRRLRQQESNYRVTVKDLRKLYNSPCLYCGNPSEHIDHIIPLSRGGSHSIGNLTGACASCNLSKGAKFITEWKKGK